MKKNFQIRYNTQSTDDSNRWRLLFDGEEILVSSIIIDEDTKTTEDYIEGVGQKYHITCCGDLTLQDGKAYIKTGRKDNAVARHLAKTVTWRIIGTIDTIVLSYITLKYISNDQTGFLQTGITIGGLELFSKSILYFLHERAWWKFGKLR